MTELKWWQDPVKLAQIHERFQATQLGRRAFLQFVGAAGGASAVTLALAACGGSESSKTPASQSSSGSSGSTGGTQSSGSSSATTPASSSSSASPAAAATKAPATSSSAKQEIVVVQGADPETLDPHNTTTRSTWNVSGSMYEPLTKVAFSDSGEVSIQPVLASAWELQGETVWQIKLRQGVKFHNGEPFNADAAKFSIERLMDKNEKFLANSYTVGIKSVEVVDDSTIKLNATGPYPMMPLDMSNIYMVPPKYTAEAGKDKFAKEPVGTGPFKFVKWVKDDHLEVQRNDDYWGGKPALTKVTFKPIPEAATRTAALVTGEADVVTIVSIPDIDNLKQASDVKINTSPSQRTVYILLAQASDDTMKNEKVRQALNYAVDKDAIVKNVMRGYATKLQGQTITPQYFGFNPDLKEYPYDLAKAKSLLAEAGFPNGFQTTLNSPRGRYIFDFETAQAVAGQLEKVGVKADVKPMEWAVYIKDLADHKLGPMAYTAWATPNDGARMLVVFGSQGLYSHTNLPEMDAILKDTVSLADSDKRKQAIQQALKLQHDQALAIFLFQLQNIYGVRSRVQGFKLLPNEAFELNDVSVK